MARRVYVRGSRGRKGYWRRVSGGGASSARRNSAKGMGYGMSSLPGRTFITPAMPRSRRAKQINSSRRITSKAIGRHNRLRANPVQRIRPNRITGSTMKDTTYSRIASGKTHYGRNKKEQARFRAAVRPRRRRRKR